jgi:hypothetical protein
METLAADPEFDPSFRQIFDFRRVSELTVTGAVVTAAVLRWKAGLNPWDESAKRAFVAQSDLIFGMSRMFEQLTAGG